MCKSTFVSKNKGSLLSVRIRGLEMLAFRNILRTYLMDAPLMSHFRRTKKPKKTEPQKRNNTKKSKLDTISLNLILLQNNTSTRKLRKVEERLGFQQYDKIRRLSVTSLQKPVEKLIYIVFGWSVITMSQAAITYSKLM